MKRRMPPLNALKAFEAAANLGSFTRAAEQLNVTQGAVSRQVRLLESQIGEALLIRHHHHMELTDAGRTLLRAVRQSFDRIESATLGIARKQHLGRLRINAPPTFARRWLLPRLGRWHDHAPDTDVTLTSRTDDDLATSAALDGAIRFGNGEWPELRCMRLMHEEHIAVCAPALAERHHGHVDLRRVRLLHVLSDEWQRYMTWAHWLDAASVDGVDLRGGDEFDLLDLAIRAAIDGLGATIADRRMIGPELASGRLVQIGDVAVQGHQSYWLVSRPERADAAPLESFKRWLADEIDKR